MSPGSRPGLTLDRREVKKMSGIARWIRHNQGLFAALIISTGLLVWTFGCPSRVTSLVDNSKKVTTEELNIEIDQLTSRLTGELDMLLKQAELKKQELLRQDEIKQKLFKFAAITAHAGTFNPAGLLTLTGSILGFGAVVDNRIKDKVIKNRPIVHSS